MANEPRNLVGARFGRLVVLSGPLRGTDSRHRLLWVCCCDCGEAKIIRGEALTIGATKSCGCLRKDTVSKLMTKHGSTTRNGKAAWTPEYRAWVSMKTRCKYKNRQDYKWYGSRGIKVCDRWLNSFENFFSDMGERPSSTHSLDRINNDGNYGPDNCRWATRHEQAINKRPRTISTTKA